MNVTIEFCGLSLDVEGTYIAEEPMVMYYPDGSGHPGSPAEFEIDTIMWDGIDMTDFFSELANETDRIVTQALAYHSKKYASYDDLWFRLCCLCCVEVEENSYRDDPPDDY